MIQKPSLKHAAFPPDEVNILADLSNMFPNYPAKDTFFGILFYDAA
jgi:hypothetical protein